jgi:hypothetical protein
MQLLVDKKARATAPLNTMYFFVANPCVAEESLQNNHIEPQSDRCNIGTFKVSNLSNTCGTGVFASPMDARYQVRRGG